MPLPDLQGVKRYLQNNHPDRILSPLQRTSKGFEEVPWDQVRRVGFYYSVGQKKGFEDFLKFFSDMATKVSKKPLFLDNAFVLEWSPGMDS